jgi:hypothetical protein
MSYAWLVNASEPSDVAGPDPKSSPAPSTDQVDLRASDADRERAAAILQAATADGRVSSAELDERLEQVYSAKSRGELAAVVKDLQPAAPAAAPATAKDVGVLANFSRVGQWVVGEEYRGTAVISSGVIDLREAEFTGPETTIHVNSWVGTVYVVVPENVEVHIAGSGILGNFKQDRPGTDFGASRRITVTGVAVLGNVLVVHKLPPGREQQLRKSLGR